MYHVGVGGSQMYLIYRTKRVKEEMPTVPEKKGTFIFISANMNTEQYLAIPITSIYIALKEKLYLTLGLGPTHFHQNRQLQALSSKVTSASMLKYKIQNIAFFWGQFCTQFVTNEPK